MPVETTIAAVLNMNLDEYIGKELVSLLESETYIDEDTVALMLSGCVYKIYLDGDTPWETVYDAVRAAAKRFAPDDSFKGRALAEVLATI